jgi:hypothetical protein
MTNTNKTNISFFFFWLYIFPYVWPAYTNFTWFVHSYLPIAYYTGLDLEKEIFVFSLLNRQCIH